jgi:hypothetical protein
MNATIRAIAVVIGINLGLFGLLSTAKAEPMTWESVTHITKTVLVDHPTGCPWRAFCGCGAVERLKATWGVIMKRPRELWLAANWFKFPRSSPAPGMVAVRRHHVFVLEAHLSGNTWLAYDANSGGHRTRLHPRSIAGYTIVNPRAGAA